jgi:hypothetical protein
MLLKEYAVTGAQTGGGITKLFDIHGGFAQ